MYVLSYRTKRKVGAVHRGELQAIVGIRPSCRAQSSINAIAETRNFAGTPLLRRLLGTEAFHRKEAPVPAPAVWPAPDLESKASLVPILTTHPTGSATLANAPTKTIQVSIYPPPEPGSICQKKARCYIMIVALLIILSLMFLGPLCWAYLADKRCRLQYERDAILSSQYPMDINAKPLLEPQGF